MYTSPIAGQRSAEPASPFDKNRAMQPDYSDQRPLSGRTHVPWDSPLQPHYETTVGWAGFGTQAAGEWGSEIFLVLCVLRLTHLLICSLYPQVKAHSKSTLTDGQSSVDASPPKKRLLRQHLQWEKHQAHPGSAKVKGEAFSIVPSLQRPHAFSDRVNLCSQVMWQIHVIPKKGCPPNPPWILALKANPMISPLPRRLWRLTDPPPQLPRLWIYSVGTSHAQVSVKCSLH